MVHAIRHAAGRHSARPHPDANRIAGLAVAITFNAALLLLLLVPPSAPPGLALPDVIQPIHWILPKTLPTQPPVPVPVAREQPRTSPTMTRPLEVALPVEAPVIIDQGTEQAIETSVQTQIVASFQPPAGPLPGVRLEYADAPAPAYPRDALRDGIEGTVMLQVLVDIDGRPLDVQVQHSSGNRQLDNAARRQVLERWRFRPAMQDGRAVQAIGLVPIAFNLH